MPEAATAAPLGVCDIDPQWYPGQPEVDLQGSEVPSVLRKLQKWGDYESYGTPVWPSRFVPMKTPLSRSILRDWKLLEAPHHSLTVQDILAAQDAADRKVGLIIDLTNHDCLYDEDLPPGLSYQHIQLVAKELPSLENVWDVARTANAFWAQHPEQYIAIHCAYGFNRTGFVVCSYLVECCGLDPTTALSSFAASRPPGVKHDKFKRELLRRYAGLGAVRRGCAAAAAAAAAVETQVQEQQAQQQQQQLALQQRQQQLEQAQEVVLPEGQQQPSHADCQDQQQQGTPAPEQQDGPAAPHQQQQPLTGVCAGACPHLQLCRCCGRLLTPVQPPFPILLPTPNSSSCCLAAEDSTGCAVGGDACSTTVLGSSTSVACVVPSGTSTPLPAVNSVLSPALTLTSSQPASLFSSGNTTPVGLASLLQDMGAGLALPQQQQQSAVAAGGQELRQGNPQQQQQGGEVIAEWNIHQYRTHHHHQQQQQSLGPHVQDQQQQQADPHPRPPPHAHHHHHHHHQRHVPGLVPAASGASSSSMLGSSPDFYRAVRLGRYLDTDNACEGTGLAPGPWGYFSPPPPPLDPQQTHPPHTWVTRCHPEAPWLVMPEDEQALSSSSATAAAAVAATLLQHGGIERVGTAVSNSSFGCSGFDRTPSGLHLRAESIKSLGGWEEVGMEDSQQQQQQGQQQEGDEEDDFCPTGGISCSSPPPGPAHLTQMRDLPLPLLQQQQLLAPPAATSATHPLHDGGSSILGSSHSSSQSQLTLSAFDRRRNSSNGGGGGGGGALTRSSSSSSWGVLGSSPLGGGAAVAGAVRPAWRGPGAPAAAAGGGGSGAGFGGEENESFGHMMGFELLKQSRSARRSLSLGGSSPPGLALPPAGSSPVATAAVTALVVVASALPGGASSSISSSACSCWQAACPSTTTSNGCNVHSRIPVGSSCSSAGTVNAPTTTACSPTAGGGAPAGEVRAVDSLQPSLPSPPPPAAAAAATLVVAGSRGAAAVAGRPCPLPAAAEPVGC